MKYYRPRPTTLSRAFSALALAAGALHAQTPAPPAAQAASQAVPQAVTLHLTRYDMPLGFADENNGGRTRQEAVRRPGPDAVD